MNIPPPVPVVPDMKPMIAPVTRAGMKGGSVGRSADDADLRRAVRAIWMADRTRATPTHRVVDIRRKLDSAAWQREREAQDRKGPDASP